MASRNDKEPWCKELPEHLNFRRRRLCDFPGAIVQFLQPWRNYCRGPQLGPAGHSMAALVGLREVAAWYASCKSSVARRPSTINKQRRVQFIVFVVPYES